VVHQYSHLGNKIHIEKLISNFPYNFYLTLGAKNHSNTAQREIWRIPHESAEVDKIGIIQTNNIHLLITQETIFSVLNFLSFILFFFFFQPILSFDLQEKAQKPKYYELFPNINPGNFLSQKLIVTCVGISYHNGFAFPHENY